MKKFLIKVNGNQYEVEVEEIRDQPAETNTECKTGAYKSELASGQTTRVPKPTVEKATAVSNGTSLITAPMTGIIFMVNVKEGDQIKKGQALIILEAMKMENEIVAPTDGLVASVYVSKGALVNAGDVLLSLT